MKIKYLTHKQATAMSADYQDLTGRPFDKDQDGKRVQQVLVAPYSRILQWQFVRSITKGVVPEHALAIPGNDRYDVIVLPTEHAADGTLLFKDLRSYLEEHVLEFNLATYHAIK